MRKSSKSVSSAQRLFVTVATAVMIMAPASGVDARDGGGRGNAYDPDTGMLCLTVICDYVRKNGSAHCLCKKVWPDNDRRQRVQLECSEKVDGRRVSC